MLTLSKAQRNARLEAGTMLNDNTSIIWLMGSTQTVPGDISGSKDESKEKLGYSASHFPSFWAYSLWFSYR